YNYNVDSALYYIQKAVAFSFPAYAFDSLYSFPDVEYTVDFEMGFAGLNNKAEILIRYGIDKNDQNAINHAFELLEKTEKYLSENNNPAFGIGYFNEFNSSYYHTLTTASNCYMACDSVFPDKGYEEKAFAYLEKMKYLQFIANMNDEKIKAEVGIPERYIVAEREMNNRIIELKNTFINRFLAEKYNDINATLKIQKEFLTLNDSLRNIQQFYKEQFPGYFQLLNNINTISLSKLQSSIDEHTAIIDYFFSRSNILYAYVILHDRTMLFNTPVSSYFRFQTDTLQQFIIAGGYSPGDTVMFNKFVSKSRYLYKKLFPPKLTEFISGIDKLIILPENSLYSLPFDVLLATEPEPGSFNYKRFDYLIKKYSISILYSAFMLLNNQDEVTGQEYSYQGYAPEFNDKQLALLDMKDISPFPGTRSYGELTANRSEVEEVGHFFENSKVFLNDDAGEYKYKTYAPESEILHLATHAQANVLNPLSSKLIFSLQDNENFGEDNILNLYEIYQTPINAKLVVLSACESNKGNLYNSEGIISLSRAFINAGAKSVVSTHWWAHDETTKDIMVDFFKGVKNELPLDEALRNSKLNFLKNTDSRFAHPYYWANFVLIGNTNPIINNNGWNNVIMFSLIGVVISVLGIFLVRRLLINR
ncbi:MAG: CHAT domain-containing protein, partial [Bacteroidales bacterium]|nr:CHAT domain-containing protein [Bacteroidales bacterium]